MKSNTTLKNDKYVWHCLINGDRSALSDLFLLYHKDLLNYAYRFLGDRDLSKDMVQDLFINLWTYHQALNPEVEVRFYLYSALRKIMVRHVTIDSQNSSNVEETIIQENSFEDKWIEVEEENLVKSKISAMLRNLSKREAEIINLKYYTGFTLKEIAKLLELHPQTVANTLQNALVKLRKYL